MAAPKVLVMGLGRSGRAAAALARSRGADVLGIDLRVEHEPIEGVRIEGGPHRREWFEEADEIIVSPGIPLTQPDLAWAIAHGKAVTGELGYAARFLDQPTVGVTGTNGKSTVVSFTGQLLEAAGFSTFVGGNLGNPLSNAVGGSSRPDVLVVEVSSYQLELRGAFSPDVGVILNLTPDHLARHKTMQAYGEAKAQLFAGMSATDLAITPDHHSILDAVVVTEARRGFLGRRPGVVRHGRTAWVQVPGATEVVVDLAPVGVAGEHNLDNAATACLLALGMGADSRALPLGLAALTALPHRMQVVGERAGVRFIDDSKATNLDAARAGIGGLEQTAVVLLGGQGKELADGTLGFAGLADVLARHRAVVTFGEAGPRISDELAPLGIACNGRETLDEAVAVARTLAEPGDAVLLSPGCASFDHYSDFEARGRAFAGMVTRDA